MDITAASVSIVGSVVLVGATLIGALVGVALGGAARYGLPAGWRKVGGPLLAFAGMALLVFVLIVARDLSASPWIRFFALPGLAQCAPGFVAASLGSKRWVLAGSVVAGLILSAALTYAGLIPAPNLDV